MAQEVTEYTNTIQLIYISYLERPATQLELAGWGNSGSQDEVIVRAITQSYEYTTLHPNNSNWTVFINKFYNRLIDRNAVISEIDGWVNQIRSGVSTVENVGFIFIFRKFW